MANASRDQNRIPTLLGVSSTDGTSVVPVYVNPTTHRVLVDATGGAGTGTVTSVSVITANGVSGTVANATTTPAITLTLGDISPTSVTSNSVQALGASAGVLLKNNAGTTVASFGVGGASSTNIALIGATVVTGNISATNLSGTNTGDQNLSGYAPLASPTFSGTQTMTKVVQTVTAMSGQALDGSLGNIFTRTLAASETFTQSNFSAGQCFMVEVKQGSGTTYTVTWFSGITWVTSGGTAPVQTTVSNGITTYGFRCTGANTFLGFLVASN